MLSYYCVIGGYAFPNLRLDSLSASRRAGGAFERNVDFSNYDTPLYVQIVDRIKARIAPRLGKGPLKHDRYFMVPFAYEDKGNHPEHSHSFISVIRVFATNKKPKLTPGLPTRKYGAWDFEAFTISWLPADFMTNPHLCVFDGVGPGCFRKETSVRSQPAKTLISRTPSN